MQLNQLRDKAGSIKERTRVGRGAGSGKGKTGGRGMKGQKSRSGVAIKGFEGGQMPIYRRLPKRGFNVLNPKKFSVVNVGRLQQAIDEKRLDAKKPVDGSALEAAGLVRTNRDGIRLLGDGELSEKVEISVDYATKAAVAAVEKAGGSVSLPEPKAVKTGKRTERSLTAKAKREIAKTEEAGE